MTKYFGGKHLVSATGGEGDTTLITLNRQSRRAKERFLLVNILLTPELCDIYWFGIVSKGNLNNRLSTMGNPTAARRTRQLLEEVLPDEIDDLAGKVYNRLSSHAKRETLN